MREQAILNIGNIESDIFIVARADGNLLISGPGEGALVLGASRLVDGSSNGYGFTGDDFNLFFGLLGASGQRKDGSYRVKK